MLKRFRAWNQKIAAGVLAACMAVSGLPMTVAAASPTASYTASRASSNTALNFSFSGAMSEKNADIADLLYRATGEKLSSAEAAYLRSEGIVMTYDDSISQNMVSASASGTDSLKISASVKTYRAYNGTQVRWVPVSVSLDGVTKDFTASLNTYVAEFDGLEKERVYTATVSYEAQITVDSSTLSLFVNFAYDAAVSAIAEQDRYEQAKLEYDRALALYQEARKEYEKLYADYQRYQQELREYNAELALYQAYMKKVNAYEKAMEEYGAYLKALEEYDESYEQYRKDLEELPLRQKEYEEYLAYLAEYNAATAQLTVMESMFTEDSRGRTMYATLMGNTVATVLARKDELVNYGGADPNDINNAGTATTALQSLLKAYRACKNTQAKLVWYADNYEAVKKNFIQLYSSLFSLGKNTVVKKVLNAEGKLERYCQFVAQLYIISTALDDSVTFDSSWSMQDHDVYSLIEECQRIPDYNSYAPSPAFVPEEREPVEKPAVPTAPKKPAVVNEPVKTWTEDVEDPGTPPTAVEKPREPLLSDFSSGAPTVPSVSAELASVISLVRSGALTRRTGNVSSVNMTFTSFVSRSVSLSDMPVVTFYDYDKKTVLYSVRVEKGGSAFYGGAVPERESDEKYSYRFAAWVDADGNAASLSNITEDTVVYASYTQTLNTYTVLWHTGTGTVRQVYEYGQMPIYPGDPTYTEGYYRYTFTGWTPAVIAVKGDASYTAQYTKLDLRNMTFAVVIDVRGERYYRTYAYGEIPDLREFEKDYTEDGYRYVFKGWSPAISPVSDDIVYEAVFTKNFLLPAGENGESSASLAVTKNSYTVTTDESVVDASYAVEEALKAGASLVIELGGAVLTVDSGSLSYFADAAYFRLTPLGGLRYRFAVTDRNGTPIDFGKEILAEIPLSVKEANAGRLNAYLDGAAMALTVQDNIAYLRLTENGELALRPYYTITVISEGGGDMTASAGTAEAGSVIILTSHTEQGFALGRLTISVGTEETALVLSDGTFVMPGGDAVIRATFEEEAYTVVFVARGEELSREVYSYGERVAEPNMSERLAYTENGVTYTFSGWDKTVSAATEDVVYTAKYEKGTVGGADDTYISDYDSNKLVTVVLPIVLSVLALGIGAAVFFYIRKKKMRK